jgi:hypothetical protein
LDKPGNEPTYSGYNTTLLTVRVQDGRVVVTDYEGTKLSESKLPQRQQKEYYRIEAGASLRGDHGTIVWWSHPEMSAQKQDPVGAFEIILKHTETMAGFGSLAVIQEFEHAGLQLVALTPIYLVPGYAGPLEIGKTVCIIPEPEGE